MYVRRSWVTFQVFLIVPLLALNLLCWWAVNDYPQRTASVRMTPPPPGSVYLDACDGRPTQLIGAPDAACVVDYPGEFGQLLVLLGSAVMFLIANCVYGVRWEMARRGAPHAPRETRAG